MKTKIIRHVLALPFGIIGAVFFIVAEKVCGELYTYNFDKAKKLLTAQCNRCGHTGRMDKQWTEIPEQQQKQILKSLDRYE